MPFWRRLPAISRYPLKPAALSWIGLLAVLGLGRLLPGLLGWLVELVVWLALCQYAVECLLATAHGRLDPPEWTRRANADHAWGMLMLLFGMLVLSWLGVALLGPELGYLVPLLFITAGPAATRSLAIEDDRDTPKARAWRRSSPLVQPTWMSTLTATSNSVAHGTVCQLGL